MASGLFGLDLALDMHFNPTVKKIFILIVLFISVVGISWAQEEARTKSRAVYAEIFGNGIIYSFNYDQRFTNRLDGLGFRAGLSYVSVEGVSVSTIPIGLNYLLGKNGKYFELGAGATYALGVDRTNTFPSGSAETLGDGFIGTMTIAYRNEPNDGGFLFRAALTPVFGTDFFWPLFAGVSFGYAF